MSTIKINRAEKIAECGKFPRTWQAIIEALPTEVISAVTARQLAAMADVMHKQFEAGHSAGYNDAK